MIFLFDENFPPSIAEALRLLEEGDCEYRHSVAEVGMGAKDEAVFVKASAEDWYLVTQDQRMSRRPAQRSQMLEYKLGVFVFTGRAEKSLRHIAAFVLNRTDAMIEQAANTRRPFIYGVTDKAKFNRLDR